MGDIAALWADLRNVSLLERVFRGNLKSGTLGFIIPLHKTPGGTTLGHLRCLSSFDAEVVATEVFNSGGALL
ncbi:hypothetical protein VNO77_18738 [Canavalia gladiata]|uniref:Uncharacterized protein n=1 Tax=Canavalia gladiata TaxID=3824 RepID=A0AAN9LRC1_CANGL